MDKAKQAKELLTHYFSLASKGWNYDHDSQAEIEEIVDLIIWAAKIEMAEEIERLNSRLNELEARVN